MTGEPFDLVVSELAERQIHDLKHKLHDGVRLRKVLAALEQLEVDPNHPGLRSKVYARKQRRGGEPPLVQSYVEDQTAGAWRILWEYGPQPHQITVLAVSKHD